MTHEQKVNALVAAGFTVGDRDHRLNTSFPGKFMVVEPYDEDELPTKDGRNGPWCLVGDDIQVLVAEGYDWFVQAYD